VARSQAIEAPVAEVARAIREQPVVHADETGWYERSKRAWLWVAVTASDGTMTRSAFQELNWLHEPTSARESCMTGCPARERLPALQQLSAR
jgi:hypothetical protein